MYGRILVGGEFWRGRGGERRRVGLGWWSRKLVSSEGRQRFVGLKHLRCVHKSRV